MTEAAKSVLDLAKKLQGAAPHQWIPPAEGTIPRSEMVVYRAMVQGTRSYIERIASQVNGCYEQGWYDACAVMIRRLLETLIIEAFEAHGIADRIKKDGDFMFLRDMIGVTLAETAWNLGRNTKKALPQLKDIGDKSAHSRRYVAFRQDIDAVRVDLRTVIQELLILAKLK
jgi:hypothetical protein